MSIQWNKSKISIRIPENFELRPISKENAFKINEMWPHRSESSLAFIEYLIDHLLSVGLFNETGELVAWCLQLDFGSLATLQVDENHLRKGYGEVVTKAICRKIATEWKLDITSNILNTNIKSIRLFEKLGFQDVDKNYWIGITKRE